MIGGKRVVLSMGGGMESTATLGLTLKDDRFRALRPDAVIFSDLGSEWPETYEHLGFVENACGAAGIEYIRLVPEVLRGKRIFGENRTYTRLIDWLTDIKKIPSKSQGRYRLCTELFKIKAIGDHLKGRFPGEELVVLIGFGNDEKNRIERGENQVPGWTNRFPLDEAGMCRCKAITYLRSIGWPVPRRSGCTFCPFSKKLDFQVQAEVYPAIFAQTVALERNGSGFAKGFHLNAGSKPVDEWINTKSPKRERVCKGCGAEVDVALHTFGDTHLYARYQEWKLKRAV